jgi:glutamine amidotransferase
MNCHGQHDIMFSFRGLASRADEHKDGFGIAFFEGRGLRHFVDHHSARRSPLAELVKSYPIQSDNVIAHIRKATQGQVALENTHPFQRELWGRYWAFAHNGNLKDFQPRLHAAFRPVGQTDSERAFCWLMQELAKAHADVPSVEELTRTLAELMPQIAAHGTFNMLLTNGEAMWAHCSTHLHYTLRSFPFGSAVLQDEDLTVDFGSQTLASDRVALIATQPLTRDETWTPFGSGELLVFRQGALLRT